MSEFSSATALAVNVLYINNRIDPTSYAPFILINHTESGSSLVLCDTQMEAKLHVFRALQHDRWRGNGYDWSFIAQKLVREQLPGLDGTLSFTPENRMFVAHGPHTALERLGEMLSKVFHDDDALKDILVNAESLVFRRLTQTRFWKAFQRLTMAGAFK